MNSNLVVIGRPPPVNPSVKYHMIISPRSQWEEYICPCCHGLMDDPVLTSCGHRMCYECFDQRKWSFDRWCPVRDDDGQGHKMSLWDDCSRDRTAEERINKLLVKCDKCKVECSVKRHRKFDCSTGHDKGIKSILIRPRSQWEEYICPDCDELMDDPVRTSCGHQMCYECFDKSRRYDDRWCPVRDDDGQEHKMSQFNWSRDRTAEKEINKLLVECERCKVKCTVKEYRNFNCSTAHKGIKSILISPRSQWEEYICPCCDKLIDDPVRTSCGHRMCYECFDKRKWSFGGTWCPVRDDDGQEYKMSQNDWSRDRTAEERINNLLVKCNKCKVECSVKRHRKFDCSTGHDKGINSILISPRSQWEEYICPDCDELMNDPVQTSCGHRMCFKCFNNRRENYQNTRCPVQDDDDEGHEMTWDYWYKDKAFGKKINKLPVKCPDCGVVCTVEEYKLFHSTVTVTAMLSQGEIEGLSRFLVNDCKEDLPHWKQILQDNKVIKPSQLYVTDNELFTEILPNRECTGIMAFHQCLKQCSCPRCEQLLRLWSDISVAADDDNFSTSDTQQRNNRLTADAVYTKLTSITTFLELEKFPPDQQQELITKVLKETLPSAKGKLSIDKLRPLLYQNGLITNEEATELLGIFSGEEKVTRLYTKMLPNKGLRGLKKFMDILYDTGWDTPSHMRHHAVLSMKLSEKISQIKSGESVLRQYRSEKAARKAIVPMVYSESLPDAVINLSMSINKLLLLMLKKHIISTTDYCWLRGACYRGRKVECLYKEILPQKGVKELKAFMEVLQDVGRKIPKYRNHRDLLKSTLQAHLS